MTFAEKLALKRANDKELLKRKNITLDAALIIDTYLVVRYQRADKDSWIHYINHIIKSNGDKRTYREMYTYFVKQPYFVAAYGYVLNDDIDSDYYIAEQRYFFFDKIRPPTFSSKTLEKPLMFKKPWA